MHSPRCGLCFVGSKRHVDASNKYVRKFDINTPENYLITGTQIICTVTLWDNDYPKISWVFKC